jgi:hypothetical protein
MDDSELHRIHERIDEGNRNLAALTVAVRENMALCTPCRLKVMGNGKDGLDIRVDRLEHANAATNLASGLRMDAAKHANEAPDASLSEFDDLRVMVESMKKIRRRVDWAAGLIIGGAAYGAGEYLIAAALHAIKP